MEYTKGSPLRCFFAFEGYNSQGLALNRMRRDYPDFDWVCVGRSEIDKHAIQAADALFPEAKDKNYGDISKIDWNGVPDFDLLTMSSPCFVQGTLVLTLDGYKSIEDVNEKDYVLTHTNSYKRVVKPMNRKYSGVVYNLECPLFNDFTCTEEHPLYVRRMWRMGHGSIRSFDNPEWLSPKQMMNDLLSDRKPRTRRYYIGYAINKEKSLPKWDGCIDNRWGHKKESNKLSELFTIPDFWYIMGRYVGDGWKRESENGNSIVICCGGRNEERLISALNKIGFHFRAYTERTVKKYIIPMNELVLFVERYGYYAHGKRIDSETINLPKDLLRGFLEGLIESDGCLINGLYKITTVSKELIYGIGQCVAKVYNRPFSIYKTLRPKKTIIEGRLVNQRDSWNISWKLDEKLQDKAFFENGYIWAPINKIEWANKRCVVYNMEVKDDNSYTANGVIVHNCQDFSTAGLQKGGEEGSGTRSSLLWECRKAILAKKPKYILMENVKALLSAKFKPLFMKWQNELASYGYANFIKVLDAQDYGVPQHRERVFMVSILDEDASYHFPKPFPLEKKLKDVLESKVDEKYYLSQKLVNYVFSNGGKDKNIKGGIGVCDENSDVPPTLTAQYYKSSRQAAYFVEGINVVGNLYGDNKQAGRIYDADGISPTLDNMASGGNKSPKIVEPSFGNSRLNEMIRDNAIPSDEVVCVDTYNKSVTRDIFCTIKSNIDKENLKYVTVPLSCAMRGRDLVNPSNREAGCTTGQRLEIGDNKANTITTVHKDSMVFEPQVLTPKRNEYGKQVRKDYESGKLDESRHNMTDLQPREDGVSNTITSVLKDNLLFEPKQVIGSTQERAYRGDVDGVSPTITAACGMGGEQTPMILGMTVNPNRKFEFGAGRLYEEISPTITCQESKNTSIVWERCKHANYKITDNGKIRAYTDDDRKSGVSEFQIDNEDAIASTVTTAHTPKCYGESMGFRIRKLTPRECFRLMGVSEEDIDNIQQSGISNTQQYKMAGNSIVVDVLYHIFRKLFVDTEPEDMTLF